MSTDLIQLSFDYEAAEISKPDAKTLEKHAAAIVGTQDNVRRAGVEGLMKIGAELAAARDRLANHGDGTFGKWVKQRCGIARSTAYRTLDAYEQFKDCPTVGQTFDVSALYLLSSESCPDEVVTEAMERAEQGEHITQKTVKEMIKATVPCIEQDDAASDSEPEDDEEDGSEVFDGWDAGTCLTEMRREVLKWRKVCKPEELPQLAQILRHFITQIEKEAGNDNV